MLSSFLNETITGYLGSYEGASRFSLMSRVSSELENLSLLSFWEPHSLSSYKRMTALTVMIRE